ncbi:MAG: carotenoid 1,2-hydratase [Nitrospirae bacterium]|nr:carotenoid 1,2-hydratase [Nitrospirota bacterium]
MQVGWRLLIILCISCISFFIVPPSAGLETGSRGVSADEVYRQAVAGYLYRFPWDHGSHDEFRTEWWYYTGHLVAENGRRFGYQLTFFRRGVNREQVRSNPSRWAIRHLYFAHFALSDLDHGQFRFAEKISRAGLGKAGAETGRLRVWLDRWIAEASSLQHARHHLNASAEDFSIDLSLTPAKSPVIHGKGGISRKGDAPGQTSHYYSFTRLATAGTLWVDGERLTVTGTSWMDHEFGSGDLGQEQVGWDWYSVQLENQTELMFYRLRRVDGTSDPASSGTVIFPDGRSQHLSASDLQVEVLDHWSSEASGARYPSRWRIAVPSLGLTLALVPELSNQELITRRSTQVTYWEGTVRATGALRGAPAIGHGYVELTGYPKPLRQRL